MEFTIVDGLRVIKFDLVYTLALAALVLFVGYALQKRVGILSRTNIPAAAVGGLLFAAIVWLLRSRGIMGMTIDNTLRSPLQVAFFSTIGLSATFSLLRTGGWQMVFFWLIVSVTAFVQNGVGIALAKVLDAPMPLGVICGSLTLTGGPATGLARASDFEAMGIQGANALIIASATFGIFFASIVGNPVATFLIRHFKLQSTESEVKEKDNGQRTTDNGQITAESVFKSLLVLLVIMGFGAVLSLGLTKLSDVTPKAIGGLLRLPNTVGAMIAAAMFRNLNDRFGWLNFNARAFDVLGVISLALFLAIALMDLKLWELAGLALPMLIILTVQIVVIILYATLITFTLMGRDYEAAVMSSGHIGFGLGITPNAVANMEALTAKFGHAPRSFLIAPVVGAFFVDFTNAIIINLFINFLV
jgi:ESS family glutamate:Na+ symporter